VFRQRLVEGQQGGKDITEKALIGRVTEIDALNKEQLNAKEFACTKR